MEIGRIGKGITADQLKAVQERGNSKGRETPIIDKTLNNFNTIDQNEDGVLQRGERRRAAFKAIDQDQSGGLSAEEIIGAKEELLAAGKEATPRLDKLSESFDSVDKDGDGELQRAELRRQPLARA